MLNYSKYKSFFPSKHFSLLLDAWTKGDLFGKLP